LKLREHFAQVTKTTFSDLHVLFEGLLFEEWLWRVREEVVEREVLLH
jgi:hypothetical protein